MSTLLSKARWFAFLGAMFVWFAFQEIRISWSGEPGKAAGQVQHVPVEKSAARPEIDQNKMDAANGSAEASLASWLEDIRLSDIIIAIFTGMLAFKTGGLYKETTALRVAADQQREDMLLSIKAAQESAKAANTTADSLRNIERAYVFLHYEGIAERNHSPIGDPPEQIVVVFMNYGRTPAIVNSIEVKSVYHENIDLPEIKIYPGAFPLGTVIASQSTWEYPIQFVETDSNVDKARGGTGAIYLYGKIAYLDTLREQRETVFCAKWSFDGGRFFMSPLKKLNDHT